ncbi:MAG: peptidase [Acidobacteria bacterium]|nr:peptidase [Acidobacteriota bacterium]
MLFIFVDGLGIGQEDPEWNPLAVFEPRILKFFQGRLGPFPKQGVCVPTDAQMGVPGLPQSATGQTSIFTGINAAELLGCHLRGFPNTRLKNLIQSRSVFRLLKERGHSVTFANAYTPGFFSRPRRRHSVTTTMSLEAQVPLRSVTDLLNGRSLFMDFTNAILKERGFQVPIWGPQEAAQVLVDIKKEVDFCLYEYFLTDWTGHRGTLEGAVTLLRRLDDFLWEVLQRMDLEKDSILVCSDHGNIETMLHSDHTLNPVPTLLWGRVTSLVEPCCQHFALTNIFELVERYFDAREY